VGSADGTPAPTSVGMNVVGMNVGCVVLYMVKLAQ
jgi:hypothetical protein